MDFIFFYGHVANGDLWRHLIALLAGYPLRPHSDTSEHDLKQPLRSPVITLGDLCYANISLRGCTGLSEPLRGHYIGPVLAIIGGGRARIRLRATGRLPEGILWILLIG